MGSYAQLMVGTWEAASYKNGVDPAVGLLFTADDRMRRTIPLASLPDYDDDEGELNTVRFVIASAGLIDRLDSMGFGEEATRSALAEVASDLAQMHHEWAGRGLSSDDGERAAWYESITLDRWRTLIRAEVEKGLAWRFQSEFGGLSTLLELFDELDHRHLLRAASLAFPDEDVVLDITDIIGGGWVDPDELPRQTALENFSGPVTHGLPVIIITEGKFDREVLKAAIELRRPHLSQYLTFLDFDYRNEGGAEAVVKTVKAMAAAGVGNRIIAFFDNDAEGRSSAMALAQLRLPPSITVMVAPDLELAEDYPTQGPSGSSGQDINGLACAIELYTGVDALTDTDGSLVPVQWGHYNKIVDGYHGALTEKAAVQERFRSKVKAAREDRGAMESQDWSALDGILLTILRVLSQDA